MPYSATHGLKESRIRFITIIDHKKMQGERSPEGSEPFDSNSTEPSTIPMQLLLMGLRCLGLQYFHKALVH
jgi:hypothetical protein